MGFTVPASNSRISPATTSWTTACNTGETGWDKANEFMELN